MFILLHSDGMLFVFSSHHQQDNRINSHIFLFVNKLEKGSAWEKGKEEKRILYLIVFLKFLKRLPNSRRSMCTQAYVYIERRTTFSFLNQTISTFLYPLTLTHTHSQSLTRIHTNDTK